MDFFHGVRTRQAEKSASTPVTANSGIAFVIGTAPVHTVNGKVNEPILCEKYSDAVNVLGYSENWGKYSICEAVYSQFQIHKVSPVVFVNVLDPMKHKKSITEANYPISDGKVLLPLEALKSTVKVTGFIAETDFELFYQGENLILEVLQSGTIPETTKELPIEFDAVDPEAVTKADIIGGFDTVGKKNYGLELLDSVFPKFGIVADLLLAPGWSHNAEVAAVMAAKATSINGIFSGKALIDVDTNAATYYTDVPMWKKSNKINSEAQIVCWPLAKSGERTYHMSVRLAGRMGQTDADNDGCPAESPSNKLLQIDCAVLADGSEVLLDIQQANLLNSNGIVTALNFMGDYVLWGNQTACFPSDTSPQNYFISVSRMFGWVSNTVILSTWGKVDKNMSRRLLDSIKDSLNIWLNGLVAEEKLLGGRIEFRDEENSTTALMAGKAVFHIYMTPASPGQEYDFVLEYDKEYIAASLAA